MAKKKEEDILNDFETILDPDKPAVDKEVFLDHMTDFLDSTVTEGPDFWAYTADPDNPVSGDWRRGRNTTSKEYEHYRYENGAWVCKSRKGDSVHTDHFVLENTDGGLSFPAADGNEYYLIKPSIDGYGSVVGNYKGRVAFITSESEELLHVPATGPVATRLVGSGGVTNTVTTFSWNDSSWGATESVTHIGIRCFTAGVGWRVTISETATGNVLVRSATDFDFENSIGLPTTLDATSDPTDYSQALLKRDWPVEKGLATTIELEFKSSVSVDGAGTIGVDWVPFGAHEAAPLELKNVVWNKRWTDGYNYSSGEYLFDDGVQYKCNTSGVQTTSFASNSAKWDEVGAHPVSKVILGSDVALSDSFASIMTITLPTAGTYRVDVGARLCQDNDTYILLRLYNETAAAVITNSEVFGIYVNVAPPIQDAVTTSTMMEFITVTESTVIRLEAKESVNNSSLIQSDSEGRTWMAYQKL